MINVSIIGASGYTGLELIRLLSAHKQVKIAHITSRQNTGKGIGEVYPTIVDSPLRFEEVRPKDIAKGSDVVFTATPHGASMEIVPELIDSGARVIDLSGDFRFKDIGVYEKYYELKHKAPELLKKAIYGLPEINRAKIKKAQLIGNPGCYVTASILGSLPLMKHAKDIIIDAKSGSSGAGAEAKQFTHHPELSDNIKAYKMCDHRHAPEIQEKLADFGNARVHFTPHLIPITRGIMATVHAIIDKKVDLLSEYSKQYEKEPFVRVMKAEPSTAYVKGSNYCFIGGFSQESNHAVVISVIDNLVKGASGQAIQNMNIMFGFDETEGLKQSAIFP